MPPPSPHHRRGVALCVFSACGFGALAIFAKEAFGAGVTVVTLLSLRFILAAALFWVIVTVRGARLPSRRVLLTSLALGAAGYAVQAGLYFGALTRIDASLTSLLLYIYPVLVFVGALALGRERASRRRLGALGLATAGTVLVLLGGSVGAIDGLGVAMALGAAVVYATYILVADRVVAQVDPFMLSALICTGAAVAVSAAGLVDGSLDMTFGAAGWGWIAAVACGSTVLAVSAFFLGLRDVGPATASIVSTAEPAVTVGLATVIYSEALGAGQLVGGALVLVAVIILQLRGTGTVSSHDAADPAPAAAPARAIAREPA
ncbi:MAG TPA: DMT family transporter [Baekduia sp.]|uniref:DMT family transporter n=1 Tax=Baekduia sp. TaxID=2600305 RepID=UPI002BE4C254|nr:DMT family transporter [Baekduia sp.]HMJ33454.1 DMT family transporter [Baekduia sp.]